MRFAMRAVGMVYGRRLHDLPTTQYVTGKPKNRNITLVPRMEPIDSAWHVHNVPSRHRQGGPFRLHRPLHWTDVQENRSGSPELLPTRPRGRRSSQWIRSEYGPRFSGAEFAGNLGSGVGHQVV